MQITYSTVKKGLGCRWLQGRILHFLGWNKLTGYDELILANDSFYGPFDDVGRIFPEMESCRLNSWGLMKCGAGAYGDTGSIRNTFIP